MAGTVMCGPSLGIHSRWQEMRNVYAKFEGADGQAFRMETDALAIP